MSKHKPVSAGRKPPGAVRAVIVYEHPAARERAVEFWRQLDEQHASQEGLDANWFSFTLLDKPDEARKAADKAAGADFVIFAVGADGDLPGAIKRWIETWLRRRSDREGTLAGLVQCEPSPGATETAGIKEIYLRQIAHRAGMDYLSQMPPAGSKTIPDSLDSFRQRAGQMTSVLDKILQNQMHPPRL